MGNDNLEDRRNDLLSIPLFSLFFSVLFWGLQQKRSRSVRLYCQRKKADVGPNLPETFWPAFVLHISLDHY